MINPSKNKTLVESEIQGQNNKGLPLTISDIAALVHNHKPESLTFGFKNEKYKDEFSRPKEGQRQYVVLKAELGQQIQLLSNTGWALLSLKRSQEAIEAFQQAIAIDPKYINAYLGLGITFFSLGYNQEAIEAYRQAIAIDPKYAYLYEKLGDVLYELDRFEEATEVYRKCAELSGR